ncbi:hypothetical protein BG005_000258 [Podila minutissima]|nr:hypothetical protein BG005_000258 [Podila minutissima]
MNSLPPELIQRIGFFLPLWEKCLGYDRKFLPQDLISCTLVSRTWRSALLPVLWSMYDDSGAETVTPLELHRNRHHIQYLHLKKSWPPGILYPTKLRRLCINSSALLKSAALIQLNPKLTALKVTVDGHFGMATKAAVTALKIPAEFADNTDDDMDELGEEEEEEDEKEWRQEKVYTFSDLHLVLETLSNLKSFHLCDCELSDLSIFLKFVRSNPSLTHLTLDGIQRLERPIGYASLTSVTNLALMGSREQGVWQPCSHLSDLVRLFPNMETLAFAQCRSGDVAELGRSIRLFCPKLTSLRTLDPILSLRYYPLPSLAAAELIIPPMRLVHYEAACSTLTPDLLTALLQHTASLQSISLYVVNDSEETFATAGKILASFPNLRTFSMGLSPIRRSQDNSWAFFDQVWSCPRLEEISLMGYFPWFQESNERRVVEEADKGFEIPDTDSDVDIQASAIVIPERHPASDRAFFESLAKVGWAYRKEIDPYGTKGKPISNGIRATRNKLFERLVHLPHMRNIKLPDARYVKL